MNRDHDEIKLLIIITRKMKKTIIFQITGMIFLLLFSSCKSSNWENDKMLEVITTTSFSNPASTCMAYRLDDSYPGEAKKHEGDFLHGYAVISDAIALNSDLRKKLSSIIEDHNTYNRHSIPVDCFFRPGIAFSFKDQKSKVDLMVCFSCNELRYYMNSEIIDQSYFKPKKLLQIVKELFPDDQTIQSLK